MLRTETRRGLFYLQTRTFKMTHQFLNKILYHGKKNAPLLYLYTFSTLLAPQTRQQQPPLFPQILHDILVRVHRLPSTLPHGAPYSVLVTGHTLENMGVYMF